jgi:hypothetical protein
MGNRIEKLKTLEALWALGELVRSYWFVIIPAIIGQGGVMWGFWKYIQFAAQLEGWWVYPVIVVLLFGALIAIVTSVRWLWKFFTEERPDMQVASAYVGSLFDTQSRETLDLRSEIDRLVDLQSNYADPTAQQHRVIACLNKINDSNHPVFLEDQFRRARFDLLHWAGVAQSDRQEFGPNFASREEKAEILGHLNKAARTLHNGLMGRKKAGPGLCFTDIKVDYDGAPQSYDSWLYVKNFGETREDCIAEVETLDLGGSTREIKSPVKAEGSADNHFKLVGGKEIRLHLTSRRSPNPRDPQPHMLHVQSGDIRLDRGKMHTVLISAHSGNGPETKVLVRLKVDEEYRLFAELLDPAWV